MELHRLRQLIESGLYRIPSGEVAQAIMDEMADPLRIVRDAGRSVPQPPHRSGGLSSTRYRFDHRDDSHGRRDVVYAHDGRARGDR